MERLVGPWGTGRFGSHVVACWVCLCREMCKLQRREVVDVDVDVDNCTSKPKLREHVHVTTIAFRLFC